jgi:hypothetical protein
VVPAPLRRRHGRAESLARRHGGDAARRQSILDQISELYDQLDETDVEQAHRADIVGLLIELAEKGAV